MSHFNGFTDDTYLELEDDWVLHRYRDLVGRWYAGIRHKHTDNHPKLNDSTGTTVDSVTYAHIHLVTDERYYCMVCDKEVPKKALGMQELVWYANRCENGDG